MSWCYGQNIFFQERVHTAITPSSQEEALWWRRREAGGNQLCGELLAHNKAKKRWKMTSFVIISGIKRRTDPNQIRPWRQVKHEPARVQLHGDGDIFIHQRSNQGVLGKDHIMVMSPDRWHRIPVYGSPFMSHRLPASSPLSDISKQDREPPVQVLKLLSDPSCCRANPFSCEKGHLFQEFNADKKGGTEILL